MPVRPILLHGPSFLSTVLGKWITAPPDKKLPVRLCSEAVLGIVDLPILVPLSANKWRLVA